MNIADLGFHQEVIEENLTHDKFDYSKTENLEDVVKLKEQ